MENLSFKEKLDHHRKKAGEYLNKKTVYRAFPKKSTMGSLIKELGLNEKNESEQHTEKVVDEQDLEKNEDNVKMNAVKSLQKQTEQDMKKLEQRKNSVFNLVLKFSGIIDENKPKPENIDSK